MNTNPDILISEPDFERLTSLLSRVEKGHDFSLLSDELDRADIVSFKDLPDNVVRMHSTVTFTVSATGKTFTAKLVYPNEKFDDKTISILSPAGSALLGLSVGESIEWPLSNNTVSIVQIDSVDNSEFN